MLATGIDWIDVCVLFWFIRQSHSLGFPEQECPFRL